MRKCFIALVSAVALLMSGCVKDVNTDIALEGGVNRTIKASIEGMTRTSMNDFEAGQMAQVVWSSGDKIGVVTETGTIRQATIDASSVGKAEADLIHLRNQKDPVYEPASEKSMYVTEMYLMPPLNHDPKNHTNKNQNKGYYN